MPSSAAVGARYSNAEMDVEVDVVVDTAANKFVGQFVQKQAVSERAHPWRFVQHHVSVLCGFFNRGINMVASSAPHQHARMPSSFWFSTGTVHSLTQEEAHC